MGTPLLACPGVREDGMAVGNSGAGLAPPPPTVTVPTPTPMAVVLVAVEEDMDMFDLFILSVVTLGSRSILSLLIRLT